MFCTNCGNQIRQGAKFCNRCGKTLNIINRSAPSTTIEVTPKRKKLFQSDEQKIPQMAENNVAQVTVLNKCLFYNENWQRVKFIGGGAYYDILIDKDNLYMIWLPSYSSATVGTIVGLFVLQLLGAILGYYIGKSEDDKKRKQFRSKWINAQYELISNEYENRVIYKIPLSELRNILEVKRNKFILNYNGQKLKFRKNSKAIEMFKQFLSTI